MADSIDHREERRAIADLGRELLARGLTQGTGGNLSARVGEDRVVISPSGMAYDEIEPRDVPVIDLDGEVVSGEFDPSVETPMHAAIYDRRPEVGGVVHTHSPYATTYACLDRPIPATHYLIAAAGGPVPVAEYASYGTEALGANAVAALGDDRDACLLRSHGVIAVGETLPDAFDVAATVEYCARIHHQAESVGEPVTLPDDEVASIRERLAAYGQSK